MIICIPITVLPLLVGVGAGVGRAVGVGVREVVVGVAAIPRSSISSRGRRRRIAGAVVVVAAAVVVAAHDSRYYSSHYHSKIECPAFGSTNRFGILSSGAGGLASGGNRNHSGILEPDIIKILQDVEIMGVETAVEEDVNVQCSEHPEIILGPEQ